MSQLITCMGGDFVVYVPIVRVRVALSNVDERGVRDRHKRWSQGFLAGGLVHGCGCPECEVEGL